MEMMYTPPHSMEAEQALLGNMMNYKECSEEALTITPEYFYRPAHKEIFEAIVEMVKKKKPIDMITISDVLKKRDSYEEIGGIQYLNDLTTAGIIEASFNHYKKIVREKMKLRISLSGAQETIDYIYSPEANHEEAEELLKNTIRRSENYIEDTEFKTIGEVLQDTVKIIEEDYEAVHVGIPTGFKEVDSDVILKRKYMVTVSGQPGAGKTTWCTNVVTNMGFDGNKVAVLSAEMELTSIAEKILLSKSYVKSNYIRKEKEKMEDHHWERIMKTAGVLSNLGIFMNDVSGKNVTTIRDELTALKKLHGLDVVMVDYLQLLKSLNVKLNDKERIDEVFSEMKDIGKKLNVLMLCISSVNRGKESRANKRPIMADLNGSGLLEFGSDVIIFVHRPSMYDDEKPSVKGSDKTEIIIEKQKEGPTGVKYINFIPEHNTFRD